MSEYEEEEEEEEVMDAKRRVSFMRFDAVVYIGEI